MAQITASGPNFHWFVIFIEMKGFFWGENTFNKLIAFMGAKCLHMDILQKWALENWTYLSIREGKNFQAQPCNQRDLIVSEKLLGEFITGFNEEPFVRIIFYIIFSADKS